MSRMRQSIMSAALVFLTLHTFSTFDLPPSCAHKPRFSRQHRRRMAQDSDSHQPVPAHGSHLACEGMAGLLGMPQELLRMVAADPVLTNRDRKLARLACRVLDGAMTPVVFRRAFISRLRADRDTFLSIAATPHLAACVEEVVWLELGEFMQREFLVNAGL